MSATIMLARLRTFENSLLVAAIGGMVLLGVLNADWWNSSRMLRKLHGTDELLRHLTLVVGMIGGVIATRERQLLSISALAHWLPERWRARAETASYVVAAVVAGGLMSASLRFLLDEWPAHQMMGIGLPVVLFEATLPLGFAVIAVRLAWMAARHPAARILALGMSLTAAVIIATLDASGTLRWPLLAILGIATLLGTPLFVSLGGTALILFWTQGDPIASLPLDHYDQITNPLLATLPLFMLTGYVLAESGASRRLVALCDAWVGHFRGGPAAVTILTCAFFTAFTGGSGVTILALGSLLMPVLLASGQSLKQSLGLLTGAGSLGVLFPPCLPLLLYSIVAQVPLEDMFLGGLIPGLVLVLLVIAWGVRSSPALAVKKSFSMLQAARATWDARWELVLPFIPIVLIVGGYTLPVPAAAITASYALFIAVAVRRELKLDRKLARIVIECGLLVGGVLLILGTAMGLTNFLITEHVPDRMATWIGSVIEQRWVFLLALNVFLLIVGCLIDIFSAIIVVAPLVVPAALAFGIDPVHLGIVFLANLELGYLTPPIGLNLFMSAYRFKVPVMEVARAALPILAILSLGVLAITYVPTLTTWLPAFWHGR